MNRVDAARTVGGLARRHLPYAPLQAWMTRNVPGDLTRTRIAALTGVYDRKTVKRWELAGLTVFTADVVAIRLGVHPMAIWGEAWLEVRELAPRTVPR